MREEVRRRADRLAAALLALVAAAIALATLRASYGGFTGMRFRFLDYGLYQGAIWNTAHGEPFRVGAGESYLTRHLSFSLALLAPLQRVLDHPFLPAFLQWLLAVAGAALLADAARRHRLPAWQGAAVACGWLALPASQGVLLSEVHGVGFMLFALPWLYHAACFHRRWAWLPLVVLCGLREEAGIIAAPLLFFLARRERSRALLWMGLAAIAYVVLALCAIFPALNDMTMLDRRGNLHPEIMSRAWAHPALIRIRIVSAAYLLLPVLVLALRAPLPFLILLPVPLLHAALGIMPKQIMLQVHYAANAVAALGVAAVAALAATQPRRPRWAAAGALFLLGCALYQHAGRGFFWPAPVRELAYRRIWTDGREAERAARAIPKKGYLVTDASLVAFAGNRQAILPEDLHQKGTNPPPDYVFTRLRWMNRGQAEWARTLAGDGRYGVIHFDGDFLALARDAGDRARAADLLDPSRAGSVTLRFAEHPGPGAQVRLVDGAGWALRLPAGAGAPAEVEAKLPAGRHRAAVRHRTDPGGGPPPRAEFVRVRDGRVLAACELAPGPGADFVEAEAAVDCADLTKVAVRVRAGARSAWLDSVTFRPAAP